MPSLSTFDQEFDSVIVERGHEYYQHGAVIKLKQIDNKIWRAKVRGTEIYQVEIELANDMVTENKCSCPYDLSPYCKHQVAVMYALRDEIQGGRGKSTKKRADDLPIEKILSQLDKHTLIQIICDQADEDPEFQSSLIANYTPQTDVLSEEHYKRLIREALQIGEGKYGFIDYWAAGRVMRSVYELLYRAQALVAKRKVQQAIPIAQAALEVLVPALQQADDSNGEIGGGIDQALQILDSVVHHLSREEKEQFFNYLLQESQDKRYEGWDFHWQLLDIAASLVSENNQQDRLFSVIDTLVRRNKDDYFRDYDAERGAKIKLAVYKQRGNLKAFDTFLANNLHLHDIRKIAIEQTLSQDNLSYAQQLAVDGIALCKDRWPGLVNDYREYLLDIARKQKDNQATSHLAEILFLSSADFTYYNTLKEITPAGNWQNVVKTIIRKIIRGEGHHATSSTAAEICAKEGLLQELWEIIKNGQAIHLAENYQDLLGLSYADQLSDLYAKKINELLKFTTGRGTYQEACRYLKQMKSLGKIDQVKRLKEEIITKYNNRPALLDELSKV